MAASKYCAGRQRRSAAALTATVTAERARRAEEQLSQLRLEFAEVYRELYEGTQMQRTLSGPRMLRRGRFEIAAEIFPVRHLSGDFFNVSDLGDTMLLAVGDIAGKGLLAGMWFTHLLGLTSTYGESAEDPADALAAINRHMCNSRRKPPLTSMFLARLHWPSGELRYCNAGHPAPVLLRAGGEVELLRDGGVVLGVLPEGRFGCGRMLLAPGDTLVGFSDGLLECRNAEGEEFGMERVLAQVAHASHASTSAMLFSIIGAAQDFAGSQTREDDCTLMVLQCKQLAR